ncbi:MAG TPA: hypothetical protein PKB06_10965, partial [Actinotalea sp.]|nr:hypothetical protein [Actinotalea sp.]
MHEDDHLDGRTDRRPAAAPATTPTEVRTARLLVAVQFVLIALALVLPGGQQWPTPGWLRAAAVAAVVVGVAIMLVAGTALGRGLTAVPIP